MVKKEHDFGSKSFQSPNFSEPGDFYDPEKNYLTAPTKAKKDRHGFARIIFWFFVILFAIGAAYGSFFIYKIYSLGKKINATQSNQSLFSTAKSFAIDNVANLKGWDKNQINVLLLGIAGKGKPGQYLTDTIMVASIDTRTNQTAFLSIPRDLYVRIPDSNLQTKINSVYQYGLNNFGDNDKAAKLVEKTIDDITKLDINYYLVLNFDGFQKIIDDIGGINVVSERDIYDARYPGPNYSQETFELSKGFHHLDGATALKYARERHSDPEGDFGRAKRQQQIMQAAKNKFFSAGTLLNPFVLNNLFNTLGDNLRTDIAPQEISGFTELAKKLDTNNINNVVLDAWNKDSLLKVSHVQYGALSAFVLIPRIGNYSEIQDLARNIFDLNRIKRMREEISQENAAIAIINKSGDPQILVRIKNLLNENLNYKKVAVLNDFSKITEDQTAVYDSTNGLKPFTLNEIATKLPASVSYDLSPAIKNIIQNKKVDMIITIGKDLIDKYNMEVDTLDDLNKSRDDQMYLNLLDNKN